jgi:hypothetical protein
VAVARMGDRGWGQGKSLTCFTRVGRIRLCSANTNEIPLDATTLAVSAEFSY